jgi:hypothetical protein
MEDQMKEEIRNQIIMFGSAEMGNKLTPYALDGLLFALLKTIEAVFKKEPLKKVK